MWSSISQQGVRNYTLLFTSFNYFHAKSISNTQFRGSIFVEELYILSTEHWTSSVLSLVSADAVWSLHMHMLTTLEEILHTAQSDVGSCGYSAFIFKEELGKITTFYVKFKASKNKTICTVIMQSKSFKEKICRILKRSLQRKYNSQTCSCFLPRSIPFAIKRSEFNFVSMQSLKAGHLWWWGGGRSSICNVMCSEARDRESDFLTSAGWRKN